MTRILMLLDQKLASGFLLFFGRLPAFIINMYYLRVRLNDKDIIVAIKYSIETTWVAKGAYL